MGIPYFQSNLFLCFFDLQFPQEHLFDHKKQLQKNQAPSKLELLFDGMSSHKSQVFLRVNTAPGFWPPVGSDGKTGRATAAKNTYAIPCHPQMLELLVISFFFHKQIIPNDRGGKSTTFEPTLLQVLTSLWDCPGRAVRWRRFMLIFSTWRTAGCAKKWQGFKIWVWVNMKIH